MKISIDTRRRLVAGLCFTAAGAAPLLLKGHVDLASTLVYCLAWVGGGCIHRNARDYRRELLALQDSVQFCPLIHFQRSPL